MSVVPLKPDASIVELVENRLRVHEMELVGTIVEVARDLAPDGNPERLAQLVRDAGELGAVLIRHGQTQALISSVKSEVDRLLNMTTSATEELPAAVRGELNQHLTKLVDILAENFDARRTHSVQNQLAAMVNGTTAEQVRKLMNELLGEGGPVTVMNDKVIDQLKVVASSNQDVVEKVTSLVDRMEAKLGLDDARERSTQKGAPFEEALHAELDAIHGRFGDEVRCVKKEYGATPNSQAGDFAIILNPHDTAGREVRVVVEAKTGKLTSPKAQQALADALENREALAAILVFDDVPDAPLGGRQYGCYRDGKFVVVFDPENPNPLALEVACLQARALAIASLEGDSGIDTHWLSEQCERLSKIVEAGREIKNGANAARRGLDRIDAGYDQLRSEALAVLDEIKIKISV
jgi:hypothetical protein